MMELKIVVAAHMRQKNASGTATQETTPFAQCWAERHLREHSEARNFFDSTHEAEECLLKDNIRQMLSSTT